MTHLNLIRHDSMNSILFECGVSANPRGVWFKAPIGKNFAFVDIIPVSIVKGFTAFYLYFTAAIYVNIFGFCFLKILKSKEWLLGMILSFNTKGVNFKVLFPCCVGIVNIMEFFNVFTKRLLSKVIKRFLSCLFVSRTEFFMPVFVSFYNIRCCPLFVVIKK